MTGEELRRAFARLHAGGADALAAAAEAGAAARRAGRGVVVISACLCGEPVRYDGRDRRDAAALARAAEAERDGRLLPLCPEILAGLGCPRPAIHFAQGHGGEDGAHLVDERGRDVTAALAGGVARAEALLAAAGAPVERAVLKERSPSCGAREVHGAAGPKPGLGAFAAALVKREIPVEDESGLPALPLSAIKK